MKLSLHKLLPDLPIGEYHSTPDTFSSSQFKDILKDVDLFHAKHIAKTVEREEVAAFDVGTYFHTGILEPHKLKLECAVFPHKVRRGQHWDAFKKEHSGKAIVTEQQKYVAERLIRAVQDSPIAQKYLKGEPEVSLFVEINVHAGEIYAPYFGKLLTPLGWVDGPKKRLNGAFKMIVKVRADLLGQTFISDLKSTSENARCNFSTRYTMKRYGYDLSGALYLDLFSLMRPELEDFIWIMASKDNYTSRSYRAEPETILVGRRKYMKAMRLMAECAQNGWQSVDYLDTLSPLPEELEWLKEKDTDLL